MPLFCRRAGALIAVSEATKQDIIRHYKISPDKIHVVYEAAAPHFRPPAPQEIARVRAAYDLPERFLVHDAIRDFARACGIGEEQVFVI